MSLISTQKQLLKHFRLVLSHIYYKLVTVLSQLEAYAIDLTSILGYVMDNSRKLRFFTYQPNASKVK